MYLGDLQPTYIGFVIHLLSAIFLQQLQVWLWKYAL